MSWILFLWIGANEPTVIQGFTTEAKCEAFADKVRSPVQAIERKKFQCISTSKL